jgi:hypothetical protein
MEIKRNISTTISIDNQIDIYPLNNPNTFYQVDEKDKIFIFGSNYVFKLKIKNTDILYYRQYTNFEDWLRYVIHAGICLLKTSQPVLNLKIGVSLKEYYQNYADFSNILSTRKVKYLFNGNIQSKPISIKQIDVFPNLYGQASFISKRNNLNNLIVINLTMENLEGIYFDIELPFLSQRYMLGAGFKELFHLQESKLDFETERLLEELEANLNQSHFETFYNKYLKKKIDFITKSSSSEDIFYIENKEIPHSFHQFMKKKLNVFGTFTTVTNGSSIAAYGVFESKIVSKNTSMEDVGISVFSDHSTFVINNKSI